ncbi:MAG: arsenate reductase ArsC [Christensenellaceae bacterium]|nr:arsenate reductase ArsC [Christensenellaceae bacterium]
MKKPNVAFICVHNSCRSQMAEAIAKHHAGDVFNSYSAGTELKPQINQDAVRTIKNLYGIDMQNYKSKLLTSLPPIDIVIKMGCEVQCPFLPHKYEEDWGLSDPTGMGDNVFVQTAKAIEQKVKKLKQAIINGQYKSQA